MKDLWTLNRRLDGFLPWFVAVVAFVVFDPSQLPAAQVELDRLPATIELEVDTAQSLAMGLNAIQPLRAPSLGGRTLVGALPHDGTIFFDRGATATFSYHDLFLRHYRDRTQALIDVEGHRLENLNALPEGTKPPKILLDAWRLDAPDLFLDGTEDRLWWTGSLVWRFDLGLPLTSLSLASPGGEGRTMVVDEGWQKTGHPIVVSVSADATNWIEVWRSSGEGGKSVVTASLPAALAGATVLYLRFEGHEQILEDLYLSLELDASALASAFELEAGHQELVLDSAGAGGAALLFWTNPGVRAAVAPPRPPDAVTVGVDEDRIRIDFPGGATAQLCRGAAGGVTGPCALDLGGDAILRPPVEGVQPAALRLVDGDAVPGYDDWAAEVARYISDGSWRSTGSRRLQDHPLGDGELLGTTVRPDGTVEIRVRVREEGNEGVLAWQVRAVSRRLGGRLWHGVSWRLRVEGLESASVLAVTEPVVLQAGWWWLEQVFRGFSDRVIDLATPYDLPPSILAGSSQSFRFAAGPEGAVVALFEDPVWAPVEVRDERARRLIRTWIPLGTGSDRTTPWRSWLLTDLAAGDGWQARDLWSEVRDGIVTSLARDQGFPVSRPRPVLVWNQPDADYYAHWIETGSPPDGVYWLDSARNSLLPKAASWGISTLYIQPPWENDAEYWDGGSGNAPWDLVVSPAIGGEPAMARFIARAHELGLRIVLWYPSTFSIRSPFYEDHPDWLAFSNDGTPLTGGWPDVAVADLRTPYLAHAIVRLTDLEQRIHPDGYWLDSWADLTTATSYRHTQPLPQLPQAEELLRTMWRLGVGQVITEGLGPLAQADAYGDYESWSGPAVPTVDTLRDLERIRGREYMLFRIGANVLPDSKVYFRALAAGGIVTVANLDNLDNLEPEDQERIRAANRAFAALGDRMDHRHLIVRDGRWVGVSWKDGAGRQRAIFSFVPFDIHVAHGGRVEEVTSGTPEQVVTPGDLLHTQAWKAYRMTPPTPVPRRPRRSARPLAGVPEGRALHEGRLTRGGSTGRIVVRKRSTM